MNRQAVSTHIPTSFYTGLPSICTYNRESGQLLSSTYVQLWSGLDLYHYNTSSTCSISYTVVLERYLGCTLTVDRLAELDILTTIDLCYH